MESVDVGVAKKRKRPCCSASSASGDASGSELELIQRWYAGSDGYDIYRKLRSVWRAEGAVKEGVAYGEIDAGAFLSLLNELASAHLSSDEDENARFIDIGSGIGKAVAAAAISKHFSSCRGVEILRGLHSAAVSARENIRATHPEIAGKIEFACGDALDEDLSSAHFVFANCAVFTPEMLSRLEGMCAALKPGALAVVSSPSALSSNCRFELLQCGKLKLAKGTLRYWCFKRIRFELPPYVCAILQDSKTKELIMEVRDKSAKKAAGKRTCFGGKMESADKSAVAGLLRELGEELGWQPKGANSLKRAVDLHVGGKLIAWFFVAKAPSRDVSISTEPGRSHIWMKPRDLIDDPNTSPWHAAVLSAWLEGKRRADVDV